MGLLGGKDWQIVQKVTGEVNKWWDKINLDLNPRSVIC